MGLAQLPYGTHGTENFGRVQDHHANRFGRGRCHWGSAAVATSVSTKTATTIFTSCDSQLMVHITSIYLISNETKVFVYYNIIYFLHILNSSGSEWSAHTFWGPITTTGWRDSSPRPLGLLWYYILCSLTRSLRD